MSNCLNAIFLIATTIRIWSHMSALAGTFIGLKTGSCLNLNGLYTAMTTPPYCLLAHGTSINCTGYTYEPYHMQYPTNSNCTWWLFMLQPESHRTAPYYSWLSHQHGHDCIPTSPHYDTLSVEEDVEYLLLFPHSTGTAPPRPTTSAKNLLRPL